MIGEQLNFGANVALKIRLKYLIGGVATLTSLTAFLGLRAEAARDPIFAVRSLCDTQNYSFEEFLGPVTRTDSLERHRATIDDYKRVKNLILGHAAVRHWSRREEPMMYGTDRAFAPPCQEQWATHIGYHAWCDASGLRLESADHQNTVSVMFVPKLRLLLVDRSRPASNLELWLSTLQHGGNSPVIRPRISWGGLESSG
ncbi:MAG: hypothetical protein QOJ65_531 [Fimbriimonadaceae bacterium]|jgi:hypothetical protein|nr:hypothetical protein [Fimbriimonadaceae bacterium]